MKHSALVIFDENHSAKSSYWWRRFDTIVAPEGLEAIAREHEVAFKNLDELTEPGSIYNASAFAEELSRLVLPDGIRVAKAFAYNGYELWWVRYNDLFLHNCLPYTQYRRLLEYLKDFKKVDFYRPPSPGLFRCFLKAHGCSVKTGEHRRLPLGIALQVVLTALSLSPLVLVRHRLMVFTGDKFEKNRDYDFRMRFIYEELRRRRIPFMEFIRSLESWKSVLAHAWTRKRPVVYSEAVAFVGRLLCVVTGGRRWGRRRFGAHRFAHLKPEERFKLTLATQYLVNVYDDIWAIRLMKWILRAIGARAGYVTAVNERNFHAFLGCKLNEIPTVGILHGVASRFYNTYDFLPGFDGGNMLSVDKYGLWSTWWKEYYVQYSKAYRPEQLYVSGLMRPLEESVENPVESIASGVEPIKVLFVSEQLAAPQEVVPYLEALLQAPGIEVTLTFRPYRDGFQQWLMRYRPQLLQHPDASIAREGLHKAIRDCDVAVGTMSTAVIEALFLLKVPILFKTQKWGDYYGLKGYDEKQSFFAEDPEELIVKVKNARAVSAGTLKDLRERYFGNVHQNGSTWVVDQLEEAISRTV